MDNKIKEPQNTNKITSSRDNIQQQSVLIKKGNKNLVIKSSTQPQSLNSINLIPEPQQTKHRLNGFSFITLQIGFMICYGIAGFYYVQSQPTRLTYNEIISIIMLGIFAVLGFGLVLSVYRCASWLGIVTALLVFAIFIQLSPILQSLWFGSFIDPYTNFIQKNGNTTGLVYMYKRISETQANSKLFIQHFVKGLYDRIKLSSYSFRVTFLSIVSFLTFMTAVIARLSHVQTMKTAIIFQVVWSLNFFLLINFAFVKSNSYWNVIVPFVFDTYGSSYVYLFAAFFGLAYTIIVNRDIPPINHKRNVLHGPAWLISSIGTALIFATFVFSYNNLIIYYNRQGKYYGENFKHMHIIFALLGSVVCTYIGSMLANKGRISFKQALVGTISGGISIGSAAPFIPNIGIALAIGSAGGLISGLITQKVHSRINKHFQYDTLGLFGPFLVSSLIGSLIVPTAVLAYYQNSSQKFDKTSGLPYVINSQKNEQYYSRQLITYQLIYAGISAAMGLAGGILSGLLCRWDKDSFGMLSNGRFFYNDFGLFTVEQITKQKQKQQKIPLRIQNIENNPNSSTGVILTNPQ